MRKAMICVSVVLAVFQLWRLVFGHHAETAARVARSETPASAPILAVASGSTAPQMTLAAAGGEAPQTCYRQYRVTFAECAPHNQACHMRAADQWDVCEATGILPQ